jgi:hypothetical protein
LQRELLQILAAEGQELQKMHVALAKQLKALKVQDPLTREKFRVLVACSSPAVGLVLGSYGTMRRTKAGGFVWVSSYA